MQLKARSLILLPCRRRRNQQILLGSFAQTQQAECFKRLYGSATSDALAQALILSFALGFVWLCQSVSRPTDQLHTGAHTAACF